MASPETGDDGDQKGRGIWAVGLLCGAAALLLLAWTPTATSHPLDRGRLQGLAGSLTRGWAGYVVRTRAEAFNEVRGIWVQPRIVCNRPGSSVAVWVGLGGADRGSTALEQIGTSADCSERGVPFQSAWYQHFPGPSVELTLAIRSGDTISARVAVDATEVTLALRDVSSGAGYSTQLSMRAA